MQAKHTDNWLQAQAGKKQLQLQTTTARQSRMTRSFPPHTKYSRIISCVLVNGKVRQATQCAGRALSGLRGRNGLHIRTERHQWIKIFLNNHNGGVD